MAKAYICEKCGRAFDGNDFLKNEGTEYPTCYFPLIVKYTDDLKFKPKYRDWSKKVYCAQCAPDILKAMGRDEA